MPTTPRRPPARASGTIPRERGRWIEVGDGQRALATWHPSAILRAPDHAAREQAYGELVSDLRRLAEALRAPHG